MEGINSRMDGLQAAILNVKLPTCRVDDCTAAGVRVTNELLSDIDISLRQSREQPKSCLSSLCCLLRINAIR